MTSALIVVDVQNDFTEDGSLPVQGGLEVARKTFNLLSTPGIDEKYDFKVATKDFHVDPGGHWSTNPDFKDSWPVHCRAGSWGADFASPIRYSLFDAVFYKGRAEAAYSGFQGVHRETFQPLHDYLRVRDVHELFVCGLATDYCVRSTALDGRRLGYDVTLLTALSAGVAENTTREAIEDMSLAGVKIW